MQAIYDFTRRPLAATIATILLSALGSQAARAEEPQAAGSAVSGLEEIVVTASKRQELLINVPVAITALGSSTLENLGVSSFNDYVGLVPGLSQRSGGAPGSGTVIIRGLNSGPQQTTSTTGFYLDDAPFTASGSMAVGSLVLPDADLTDVERIEVLKGPQGTLYGASSLGGLVRIISKRPDLTGFSGNVGVSGTNVDNGSSGYGARATLNMPLMADRVGLRLSGFYRTEPGFTTNVGTGHVNVNEAKIDGGRLSLLAKFNDDVDLLVTGLYQKTQSDGPAIQDNRTDTLVPIYGERKFSAYFDPTFDLTIKTIAGTLNWKAGPGTLTATLARNQYDSVATADFTASYLPLLAAYLPSGSGIKAIPQPSSKKLSAEVRYSSDRIGNWEFLGGGFYTDEDDVYALNMNGEVKATQAPLPGILHNLIDSVTTSTYKESAAFGDATYYFTDSADMTIGARYAKNKQDVDITRTGLLFGFFTPHTATFNLDDNATTYLATLRWRASESISTFLRASSGYRPGGPQTSLNAPDTTPYGSDTVWNYEAGVKAALLDGRMSLSSSIYHIDWKDMQLATLNGGFILTGNAGEGKVNGLELDLQYRPVDSVTLGMNFGYTDTEITSISPGASASLGAMVGDPFPLTAKYTGAATADYWMPISKGTTASFGLTFKYQGERPSSFSAAALNPTIDLPAYTTLDLRIGLDRGPYRVQLRADNMTDEAGITTATTGKLFPGQPVPTTVALIRPRSYSLSFTANF